MAGENFPTAGTPNVDTAVSTTAATAPVASAPVQAMDPALPTVGNGKNVVLPSSALGKLKAEQRERGMREAMSSIEAKFRASGFGSLDEALAAAAAAKSAPKTTTQTKAQPIARTEAPVNTGGTGGGKGDRRQVEKLQRERERLAKQFAQEQAQRRRLQRQLEAKEAEMALRETAAVKGVRDVDYALRLLQRELEGKDEAALKAFDESKFFDTLRASHPYLYGETTVPANTGTGVGSAPTAPKASTVQAAAGQAGVKDARSLSTDEFQKLLRSRGLSPASA